MTPPRIHYLAFSGGGMKGLAYIGALRVLERLGILPQVLEITGTSIGALFGLLVAIGYTSSELTEEWVSIGVEMTKENPHNPDISIHNLIEMYGLDDGSRIEALVAHFLSKKEWPPLSTFEDVFGGGHPKQFSCVVTNLNERRPMVLSVNTTPDLRIVDAIRMSMSLPIFFTHGKLSGDVIVDGGITCNLPIELLFGDKPKDTVLGFYLRGLRTEKPDVSSFETFIGETLSCLLKQIEDFELERYLLRGYRIVTMTAGDISTFTPGLTKNQILGAIYCGECATATGLQGLTEGARSAT